MKQWQYNVNIVLKTCFLFVIFLVGLSILLSPGLPAFLGFVIFIMFFGAFLATLGNIQETTYRHYSDIYDKACGNTYTQPNNQYQRKEEPTLEVKWDSSQTSYRAGNHNSEDSYQRWCNRLDLEPESPGSKDLWQEYQREQREYDYYKSGNSYEDDD